MLRFRKTRVTSFTNAKRLANCAANLTENSFEVIQERLMKNCGGCVSLTKDTDTGIATILLDNPKKRNAMSGQMMVAFRHCVEDLEGWQEGKGLILTGKGSNFCSGGDLDYARNEGSAQAGLDMSTWMQDALRRLQRLPLVSVCLVHGPSFGGGAELSTFCDFIVAAENVKYGFVQGKLGITTAWGGGTGLVSKIGRCKALDIMLTARVLTAKECVDVGLAETVVPTENAIGNTMEWLTSRLQHHHTVTRAMKEIASNAIFCSHEDAFRLEKFKFAPLWEGEIHYNAVRQNIKHSKK